MPPFDFETRCKTLRIRPGGGPICVQSRTHNVAVGWELAEA